MHEEIFLKIDLNFEFIANLLSINPLYHCFSYPDEVYFPYCILI